MTDARTFLEGLAESDQRVTGAALTGSHARGAADRWSDLDLFLGVDAPVEEVLADWTTQVYDGLSALHHFDLHAGTATYRAFLLSGGEEVDLGFCPAADWGPRGGAFAVLFGTPAPAVDVVPLDTDHVAGLAWHHARHAHVCLERGRLWQAEHWVSALRDHVLTLAAARHGLDTSYARGAHLLPSAVTEPLRGALVRELTGAELRRALGVAVGCFVAELRCVDERLAGVLTAELRAISA